MVEEVEVWDMCRSARDTRAKKKREKRGLLNNAVETHEIGTRAVKMESARSTC